MSEPTLANPTHDEPASRLGGLLARYWPTVLIGAGLLLTLLGSVLPWADAPHDAYGTRTIDGAEVLGLRQGLAGGDAWLTITAAAAATGIALLQWRKPIRPRWILLITLGLFTACWPIASSASIPGDHGTSIGIWISILGGLALTAGAITSKPHPDDLHDADIARVIKYWNIGRLPDAIALQHRVVARDLADTGWSRTSGLNILILANLHAETGNRPLCDDLIAHVNEHCTPTFTDHDHELAATMHHSIHATLTGLHTPRNQD